MKTKKMKTKTRPKWRGWKKQKPSFHQRTIMLKKCGKRCFLGPNKSFPICSKNTCKTNKKGIWSAYIRAREYSIIKPRTSKYRAISKKARQFL